MARWGSWSGLHITVDIELTNRCNAACSFCPREKTPHQGLMSDETFCCALERTVEHRDVVEHVFPDSWFSVVFCGMGEPLLHPRVVEYARRATAAGLEVHLSTNGSLLDDATGRALLDAGVGAVFLNIGDHGAVYEAVYRLPFERTGIEWSPSRGWRASAAAWWPCSSTIATTQGTSTRCARIGPASASSALIPTL